jgi:hypothetical protein
MAFRKFLPVDAKTQDGRMTRWLPPASRPHFPQRACSHPRPTAAQLDHPHATADRRLRRKHTPRKMHDWDIVASPPACHFTRCFRICAVGQLSFILGRIDRCIGRRIHNQIGGHRIENSRYFPRMGKIEHGFQRRQRTPKRAPHCPMIPVKRMRIKTSSTRGSNTRTSGISVCIALWNLVFRPDKDPTLTHAIIQTCALGAV